MASAKVLWSVASGVQHVLISKLSPRSQDLHVRREVMYGQTETEHAFHFICGSNEEVEAWSSEVLDLLHHLSMNSESAVYANPRREIRHDWVKVPKEQITSPHVIAAWNIPKVFVPAADEKLADARRLAWRLNREYFILKSQVAEAAKRIKATRSDKMSGMIVGKLRDIRLFLEKLAA